jgi:hypothetical protein
VTLVGCLNMRSQVAEGARFWQIRTQPTLYNTSSVPSCMRCARRHTATNVTYALSARDR